MAHEPYIGEEERRAPEFQADLIREREWVKRSHQELWRGLNVYFRLLGDYDPALRIGASYLLGRLARYGNTYAPDSVATIATTLRRQLDNDGDELVQASLVFALGAFAPQYPDNLPTLRHIAETGTSLAIRVTASIALSEMHTGLPDSAVDLLLSLLHNREQADSVFKLPRPGVEQKYHPIGCHFISEAQHESIDDIGALEDIKFPWIDGKLSYRLLEILCRLYDHTERLLPIFLPLLQEATPNQADNIIAPILTNVFQGQKLAANANSNDLSTPQRVVLRAIYANVLLWATDIGGIKGALWQINLPRSRPAFGALINAGADSLDNAQAQAVLERIVRAELKLGTQETLTDMHFAEVKELVLSEVGTDAFISLLHRFPNLENLSLRDSEITDEGLALLPKFAQLRQLNLAATQITDMGLKHLARLSSLEQVILTSTAITMLEPLHKLTKLKEVWVYNTAVSGTAIARFRETVPGCLVRL